MSQSCVGFSVYRIANWFDGKSYIGRTLDCVSSRLRGHISCANTRGYGAPKLYAAMNDLGSKSFFVEKIGDAGDSKSLASLERDLIAAYDTVNNGYNMRASGRRIDDAVPDYRDVCSCYPDAFVAEPRDAAYALRCWRESRGLTCCEMQSKLVCGGGVSAIENRTRRPGPDLASRIAHLTGIDATDWSAVVIRSKRAC